MHLSSSPSSWSPSASSASDSDTLRQICDDLPRIRALIRDLPQMIGVAASADAKARGDAIRDSIRAALIVLDDEAFAAEDIDSEPERVRVTASIQVIAAEYKKLQVELRDARLHALANLERQADERRQMLLTGNNQSSSDPKKPRTAAVASAELSNSLKQAVDMISAELEKSRAASELLAETTKTLQKTDEQYSVISDVMKTSGRILGQLNRQSLMDRFLILGGLSLFLLTCAWIIWRRLWIPGLGLLFPAKLAPQTTTTTHHDGGSYHVGGAHDEL